MSVDLIRYGGVRKSIVKGGESEKKMTTKEGCEFKKFFDDYTYYSSVQDNPKSQRLRLEMCRIK